MTEAATAEFEIPVFTGIDAAFGAEANRYLTADQMGADFYADRNRYTGVAQALFFDGGSLAQHGLRFKAGIDKAAAMTAIRAWLCSFAPKHEIKIGTVGYALSRWCEDCAPESAGPGAQTPHQARRKKKRRGVTRIRKSVP